MTQTPSQISRRPDNWPVRSLKFIIFALAAVSGLSLFVMIGAICLDVVLRLHWVHKVTGFTLLGVFDIVRVTGAITLAAALPYTTAVKGHVAIEYFFHKLNRTSRLVVDSLMRLLSMGLFAFLGWRSIVYGVDLRRAGQVMQTLEWPIFWLPWFIGLCCFMVVLVITFHLLCPRRELIKP
jgi:TRAP-type C4-dicarboxylate transport system permease small subunit